ncbi:MAG: tRNA uridine-5-carboxymethylaminomethyl(34) synthesis GTPase MnmE [Bacteroidota bacterium]
MVSNDDTIVALATPPGAGAIAVIRVSGPAAIQIVESNFRGRIRLSTARSQSVLHGIFADAGGEMVDEVMATVFRAPRSYTGEDVVEISCHGGMVIVGLILDALCKSGGRMAQAGEYTRRAFLNGKMDLSQAEAVMQMITMQSRASGRVAMAQLEGKLGERVGRVRKTLIDLCALLELELDFVEESLELVGSVETQRRIEAALAEVQGLAASYEAGRKLRDGVNVVLTGKPNAGKSSLFNALLKEARAIVTPIPGTTRDTLEEAIEVGGYLFRLQDTAGVRESRDPIEKEGVERSLRATRGADIVVAVEDPGDPLTSEELDQLIANLADSQLLIRVISKCDLLDDSTRESLLQKSRKDLRTVLVSSTSGWGLNLLEEALKESVERELGESDSVLLINRRHYDAFRKSADVLKNALNNWGLMHSNELIVIDVHEAANLLGEITGDITSETVLNSIFDHFCIGK